MAATWVEERVTWKDGMKVVRMVVGMDDSSVALLVASMDKKKAEQLVELKVETMVATWVEERVTWMDGMKVAW